MAAEMCDLPGQGDGETGFYHSMADGEAAGMNRQGTDDTIKRHVEYLEKLKGRQLDDQQP